MISVNSVVLAGDRIVTAPTGHLLAAAGDTYDLGATGTKWRRLILSGYVVAPTIGPVAAQQHTLPAVSSDTIALLAATQTFTNKTLTSPVINTPTITTPAFGNGSSMETATASTTDGTVTTVWSKALSDNTAYDLEVTLVGRRTDSAGRAVFRRRVTVYVESGVATLGTPDVIGTDLESTGGYDITIDMSSTTVRVRATGNAGHSIKWNATVRLFSAAS